MSILKYMIKSLYNDEESRKIPRNILKQRRMAEIERIKKFTDVNSLLQSIEDDKVNIQEEEKKKVPEGQPDTDLILKLPDEENIKVDIKENAVESQEG